MKWSWDSFFYGALALGAVQGIFSVAWHLKHDSEPTAPSASASASVLPAASVASPPPPAPPPCVKETCAERPAFLNCAHWLSGDCQVWRIDYVHHCDCVEWKGAE